MGRPSEFTQEKADEICDWLENGGSLRGYCKDEAHPGFTTVKRWLREHETFRAQYAQARDDQADTYADAVVEIADDEDIAPEHKRLMIDARKWAAGKLKPKTYGDKVEHSGPDGGPLEIVIRRTALPDADD